MGAKSLVRPSSKLYDKDFALWATKTAQLLREGRFDQVDIENVAEEIEDMAKRDRRELLSRLAVLISHLLKWHHQPEKRSGSWEATILSQRTELDRLLKQSPSLRKWVRAAVGEVYGDAVAQAVVETRLGAESFPRQCPYSPEQILDRTFLPVLQK